MFQLNFNRPQPHAGRERETENTDAPPHAPRSGCWLITPNPTHFSLSLSTIFLNKIFKENINISFFFCFVVERSENETSGEFRCYRSLEGWGYCNAVIDINIIIALISMNNRKFRPPGGRWRKPGLLQHWADWGTPALASSQFACYSWRGRMQLCVYSVAVASSNAI